LTLLLSLLDLEGSKAMSSVASRQGPLAARFRRSGAGQALVAASRTVKDRNCHSLHAYFLRAGDPKRPILYEVDRSRDGLSFSARRVVAIQNGEPIFTMSASFESVEEGLEHQSVMPEVPDRKASRASRNGALLFFPTCRRRRAAGFFARVRSKSGRSIRHRFAKGKHQPRQVVWFRAAGPLPSIPALHQCVLAYASDMTLLDTSLLPHGFNLFTPDLQLASLDHAMWFHRPFRADEWLLYVQESPSASGSRSFNRGEIFRRDGVLAASVAQEGW